MLKCHAIEFTHFHKSVGRLNSGLSPGAASGSLPLRGAAASGSSFDGWGCFCLMMDVCGSLGCWVAGAKHHLCVFFAQMVTPMTAPIMMRRTRVTTTAMTTVVLSPSALYSRLYFLRLFFGMEFCPTTSLLDNVTDKHRYSQLFGYFPSVQAMASIFEGSRSRKIVPCDFFLV